MEGEEEEEVKLIELTWFRSQRQGVWKFYSLCKTTAAADSRIDVDLAVVQKQMKT